MKVDLPDINSVKSGSTNVKKICHGSQELWPNHQSYILYDWIQNTSPAYINTGVLCKKEYKYEFKVKYHDSRTISQFYPSFGSVTDAPRYAVWGIKRNDRSLESCFYYNGNMYGLPSRTTLTQLNDIAIHTIDVYNYTVSIQLYRNGTLVD
jgi:hypothetical protein